jgi:phosphoglycerol transferase MdoB-like AlkP superfamily enzyme
VIKLLVLLCGGLSLRLALAPQVASGWSLLGALGWGVLADLGLALIAGQPAFSPVRRGARWTLRGLAAIAWFAWPFWLLFQYFYFAEFGTRPDQIVLDYIFYTGEVTGNVWESYPVVPLVAGCVGVSGALTWWFERKPRPVATPRRVAQLAAGLGLFGFSLFVSPPIADRTTRELARNGFASLLHASLTGELEYPSHYKVLPGSLEVLREELRRDPEFVRFVDAGVRRRVAPGGEPRSHNVVLVIAESLGRELTGDGRQPSLTPRFDALVGQGLLFDRFYATGTRTARALEGALAGFPPIPGNAIVRFQRQRPLDTLASVLGGRGYRTTFVYGGGLGFDNMGDFLAANGFEERIANAGKDAPGAFVTSWGAADEFVFDRVLGELRRAREERRPLFLTVLTVSNHRPFQFPEGRIEGQQRTREGATRYADWALGRFFEQAEREGFDRDTLFAVVGEHGPRSYTRERLPADAHRVPFLLWGVGVPRGERSPVIGSTIDVAPTILGRLGGEYEAGFYGRNLLRVTDGGRALIQDKRDLGVITAEGMTVIGFRGRDEFVPLDAGDRQGPAVPFGEADRREALGVALFQSAWELHSQGLLSPQASLALGE